MELLEQIKENAKKQCKTIVLPEGTEERTIQAADQIIGEGIAKIILIGNPAEIQALAQKHNLKNIGKATVIDPESHAKKEQYALLMVLLSMNGASPQRTSVLPSMFFSRNGMACITA